jgi:hypothetical protein
MKKPISVASRKQKGRKLQQYVRDAILRLHPTLTLNDVRSTGMGQSGLDVQLSEAARKLWKWAVECKSKETINVYAEWEQAVANKEDLEPLLVIKKSRKPVLAVLEFDTFMKLLSEDKKG